MKFWIPYICAAIISILLGIGLIELLKYFWPEEPVKITHYFSICTSFTAIGINSITCVKSIKLNRKLNQMLGRRKHK